MGNGIDEPENATHKRCSCKEQIKSSTCLILRVSTLGISSVRIRGEIHGVWGVLEPPRGWCLGGITNTERERWVGEEIGKKLGNKSSELRKCYK